VGDCKYKNPAAPPPDDCYQLLAYLTALNLTHGMLIYAGTNNITPPDLTIQAAAKHIHLRTLDLHRSPHEVLSQTADLANEIKTLVAPIVASQGEAQPGSGVGT